MPMSMRVEEQTKQCNKKQQKQPKIHPKQQLATKEILGLEITLENSFWHFKITNSHPNESREFCEN